MVAAALQTGLMTYNGLVVVANRLLSRMSTRHGEAKAYRHKMRTAKDYEVCLLHSVVFAYVRPTCTMPRQLTPLALRSIGCCVGKETRVLMKLLLGGMARG